MKFYYPVPSDSIVTQTFQQHINAAKVHNWQYYNGGIDWAIRSGSPLVSAQDGIVLECRTDATGYGTHLRIDHGDKYTAIYGHMMDFAVKPGDAVIAGQVIGRSDNTGNSTGPHLHFEVRKNGVPIDPMPLLVKNLEDLNNNNNPVPIPNVFDLLSLPKTYPKVKIVTTYRLNIRNIPSVSGNDVGDVFPNEVLEFYAVAKDNFGNTWLKIGDGFWIAAIYNDENYAELL